MMAFHGIKLIACFFLLSFQYPKPRFSQISASSKISLKLAPKNNQKNVPQPKISLKFVAQTSSKYVTLKVRLKICFEFATHPPNLSHPKLNPNFVPIDCPKP
jgi:hypothetical protein